MHLVGEDSYDPAGAVCPLLALCRALHTQIHIQVTNLRSVTRIAHRRPFWWTAVTGYSANVDDLTTYLVISLTECMEYMLGKSDDFGRDSYSKQRHKRKSMALTHWQ